MKFELSLVGDRIKIVTPYSPLVIERIKAIPGLRFESEDKSWTVPAVRDVTFMLCDLCGILPDMLSPSLKQIVGESEVIDAIPKMELIEGHPFNTAPYHHQKENLARLIEHPRWLLADVMGTGKSHPVCNLIRHVTTKEKARVLILCPKSVMDSWVNQLLAHAGNAYEGRLIRGTAAQKRTLLVGDSSIKITNYESLLNIDLYLFECDILVLDEIQKVKNFTAQTSKRVQQISRLAKRVYGLSGTPAPNGLQDWCGVLAAIDPDGVPWKTKGAFESRYCHKSRIGGDGPWVISGYRNVSDLHGIVKRYTSRVTKEVCIDLPEKVFHTRTVSLNGEQARIYREIRKNAVSYLELLKEEGVLSVNNVLTESMRLLQIVGGFVPDDDGRMHKIDEIAKITALQEVLEEIGDKQLVIWTAFRAEAEWIAEWLTKEYKALAVTLTGATTGWKRGDVIKAFHGGFARFFVGTSAAGGTGVNGLEVADTEVFYSRNYNLAEYLQTIDRLHRIGQKNTVNVIRLIASGTVDEKIEAALEHKTDLQEMMLGRKVAEMI